MASGTLIARASFNRVPEVASMSTNTKMTGRLIAAARALTSISQVDFAAAAGLPVETLRLMEASGSARLTR